MPIPSSIDIDDLWQDLGKATADLQSGAPGLVVRTGTGMWRVTCDVDSWTANWIACHAFEAGAADVLRVNLDEVEAMGRTTSLVVRDTVRDEVVPLLEGRAARFHGNPPLMWRGNEPFAPNPRPYAGNVRRLDDDGDPAIAQVIGSAFGVDPGKVASATGVHDASSPIRIHVAESDAIESVCVTWMGKAAVYIEILATSPDRQRRGAGREVMVHAMQDWIADGAPGFWLMASDDGQPLYHALGFETFERPEFWTINPEPE